MTAGHKAADGAEEAAGTVGGAIPGGWTVRHIVKLEDNVYVDARVGSGSGASTLKYAAWVAQEGCKPSEMLVNVRGYEGSSYGCC